jgi:glucose-6-phosphate 1-dehydrogenase
MGEAMGREALEPHLFVIFGGTGDLAKQKLLPALAGLAGRGRLPTGPAVLAVGRDQLSDAEYRASAREPLLEAGLEPGEVLPWLEACVHYQTIGRYAPGDFAALAERMRRLEHEHRLPGHRVFYLALPPSVFAAAIDGLGEAGLNHGPGWTRLVIEKPFGTDLESARELNHRVHQRFAEDQVYRIDHYLGKETVQNLLVFRFANPIFESLWNRDRIDRVQITVAESVGAGQRAGYYDRAGALRDMVQNHLTQLLTLVAMEVPAAFDAEAIRAEKVKVLRSVQPLGARDVVWGQYTGGKINGETVPGYRDEPRVPADSSTETFVALRLEVANWRWQGVPFVLRTGKRMPQRVTQVSVLFRRPPVSIFQPYAECRLHSNVLTLRLQPDEGFELGFEVKTPGEGIDLTTQRLRFAYADAFGRLRDSYETLLLDVVAGDQTLFVHADEVEAAWRLYTPLLEKPHTPLPYAAGSWGPEAADRFAPALVGRLPG